MLRVSEYVLLLYTRCYYGNKEGVREGVVTVEEGGLL